MEIPSVYLCVVEGLCLFLCNCILCNTTLITPNSRISQLFCYLLSTFGVVFAVTQDRLFNPYHNHDTEPGRSAKVLSLSFSFSLPLSLWLWLHFVCLFSGSVNICLGFIVRFIVYRSMLFTFSFSFFLLLYNCHFNSWVLELLRLSALLFLVLKRYSQSVGLWMGNSIRRHFPKNFNLTKLNWVGSLFVQGLVYMEYMPGSSWTQSNKWQACWWSRG